MITSEGNVYITGMDVSRWQGTIDWKQAKSQGVRFVFVRATYGSVYVDPNFLVNVEGAKAAGLLVGAYHVVVPSYSAQAQMELFNRTLAGRDVGAICLDCELNSGQTVATISKNIYQCDKIIRELTGKMPALYSRKYWWDPWTDSAILTAGWCNAHTLWVAHYTNDTQPLLPKTWWGWHLWQWSADKNGLGAQYGVQSTDIDLDRFNGTEDDLYALFGVEPEPPLTLEQRVDRLEGEARSRGWAV